MSIELTVRYLEFTQYHRAPNIFGEKDCYSMMPFLWIPKCVGFCHLQDIPIDWFPITRDCVMYAITVVALIGVISNNIVEW